MAEFSKGDRVIATKDIEGALWTSVSRGTGGTVIRINDGFSRDTFTVKFDNGKIEDVEKEDLFRE